MKIFAIIVIVAVVLVSCDVSTRKQFNEFKQKYNRSYKSADEEEYRYNVFQENMKKAAILSEMNPLATFGVNLFADISSNEFASKYLMKNFDISKHSQAPVKTDFSKKPTPGFHCNPNPTDFDWSECNTITHVYNEGQCGSCWAISASETIESYYAIAGYPLTNLSFGQIVDCDVNGNDEGCNGGYPTGAYNYVMKAGGLETFEDYPYTAENGEVGNCTFKKKLAVATITGYQMISGELDLYKQVSSSSGGPVSICIDAESWQSYTSGILTTCGNQIDMCVQLTGYYNYGQPGAYWNVRNQWTTSWGMDGYIRIAIGSDLCGIGDLASIVTAVAVKHD